MNADNVETEEENKLNFNDWTGVDQMESMCMACEENGITRFLLHKVPRFRELVIASFYCEHCGERNNEVSFGGEIQEKGCIYELNVTKPEDLNRQIIKSDSASVYIRDLDFEIPPMTQKGSVNTLEGLLKRAANDLASLQPLRMIQSPEIGAKVAEVIEALEAMADGSRFPFHIKLDDPAGNSFIENLVAPLVDLEMSSSHYKRSPEQDGALGLDSEKDSFKTAEIEHFDDVMDGKKVFGQATKASTEESQGGEVEVLGRTEVLSIPSPCPSCMKEGESLTALTNIPHFKEVIIMSFACKFCGHRNSDVKGGGAVPTFGTEVALKITSEEDLKRDVLKSDSAMITIPELDLELQHGSLGGVFSTVEGLMQKIHKNLQEQNPFATGDSYSLHHSVDPAVLERTEKFIAFMGRLKACADGRHFPYTLIIRDPLGNSFISAPLGTFLPPELDSNLSITDFERTWEENEEFGLNDMNTKDFETGYEDEGKTAGPVLPDRLTNVHPKVVDHPTPFAKGMYVHDSTLGALDPSLLNLPPTAPLSDHQVNYAAVDAEGESAAEVEEEVVDEAPLEIPYSVTHRVFDDDSELDYLPYEEFSGRKEGYVFRLGSKGLGYYTDRHQKLAEVNTTA